MTREIYNSEGKVVRTTRGNEAAMQLQDTIEQILHEQRLRAKEIEYIKERMLLEKNKIRRRH